MEETNQQYLGDGVYASHDGYHIWLSLQDGSRIALEPKVMDNLLRYHVHVRNIAAGEMESE